MIIKIVTLFLVGIGVLAMFGKLRLPRLPGRSGTPRVTGKCRKCGAPKIGKGPCPCGQG